MDSQTAVIKQRIADALMAYADAITPQLQSDLAQTARAWEAEFGEPWPTTLEDKKRWAARIGFTPQEFNDSTEADLFMWIEGYLQRKRDIQNAQNHTRQSDTKSDISKKRRPMNIEAVDCCRIYRERKAEDPTYTMKQVVFEYIERNGGSNSSIMRILNDNPDQWK